MGARGQPPTTLQVSPHSSQRGQSTCPGLKIPGLEHPDDTTLDARTPYVPPRQNEPDAMDEDPLLEVDAAPLMLIDMDVPDENLDPDPDPEPRPEEEPEWRRPMTPDLYSVTIKAMLVPRVVGWRIVLPVGGLPDSGP